ncbi:PRC-barrel domain-containing protein [Rhizobium sp. SL86]|jgi:sporulation protein YlmC with PRC-barrel domain|uniref:PRC-barrel domain-containing protein n=1 Tax=Rhizobium sp. SL86 TaxID=2995148 RepID=UPI002273B84B|nr:PRC-barrel domain-containing protein [Rhizobium sp. SL86]MCY1665113.1 PRC-barrel domain-containing protein [Rhizobium sp. SL86]
MTKKLIAALAFSTVLPFAALAQTSTTTPAAPGTAPAAQDGTMTNQNNARGGMADSPRMTQAGGPFVEVPNQGAWRVSDLEGKTVYGSEGENIGEINDVLVSQDGSVNAVIIGVGGFLGIGEKDVAVQMSALQLGPGMTQDEANAAAANSPAVSGETTASTTGGANTSNPVPGANTTAGGAGMGANSANTAANPNAAQPGAAGQNMAANTAAGQNNAQIGEDGLPERIVLNVSREQLEQAPAFEGMTPAR